MYKIRTPLGDIHITSSKDFIIFPSEEVLLLKYSTPYCEAFVSLFLDRILAGDPYTLLEDKHESTKFICTFSGPDVPESLKIKVQKIIDLVEENKIDV